MSTTIDRPAPVHPNEWAAACARSQVRSDLRRPFAVADAPRRPRMTAIVHGARRALTYASIGGATYCAAAAAVIVLTP